MCKIGAGLVPVRWVLVEDRTSTHLDEDFFTTNITLAPRQIIEADTSRWEIVVIVEDVREHVGLETTRSHCDETILRAEPCLFGLYTLVALWFANTPGNGTAESGRRLDGYRQVNADIL